MSRGPLHSDTWTYGLKLTELRREFRHVYGLLGGAGPGLPLPPGVTPPEDELVVVLDWDFGTILSPTGPSVDFGNLFNPNSFTANFGGI